MTQLEEAVNGSGNIAFSMEMKMGYPLKILSEDCPFYKVQPIDDEYQAVLLGDIIHPDDYQPFCEVINEAVNGAADNIKVHSRLKTGENEYCWYYISGKIRRSCSKAVVGISGMMFDVTDYLDCEIEDAVMLRFRSKHDAAFKAEKETINLIDILGEEYLVKIQRPFSQIKGLYSAIVDNRGKNIAVSRWQDRRININKMNYQRKKSIRIRHQTVANWIIAGATKDVVNDNAQLLDTMVQTVSGIANSYVVLVDEMENSQSANKLLGQNFEDQILINNIYSTALKSRNTKAAIMEMAPNIIDFFELSDIVFCKKGEGRLIVYKLDKSGIVMPMVIDTVRVQNLAEELDYSGLVCTDTKTLNIRKDSENCGCVIVKTFNNASESGIIMYTSKNGVRTWSNRERKMLKSLTQILSTVIYKMFVEEELRTYRERLEKLAYYDIATNIPNRSMFEKEFPEEIARGAKGAVIAVEIPDIKSISEIHSCEYADNIIRSIAEYISAMPCGKQKKVYRFSSDILFIMLSGIGSEEARQFAEAVLTKLRSPWYFRENEHHITAYAGVMSYPEDSDVLQDCIAEITSALRLAKERKYEDAVRYSKGIEEKLTDNQLVKKLITESAENGFHGFYFLYQPVFEVGSGDLYGCEAHLFWGNSETSIPKGRFLPILDSIGYSKKIYHYVTNKVCEFCAYVRELGCSDFNVSISIPENILNTETSVDGLREALLEYSLPPSALSVSISEREKTFYKENIFLQQISNMGINIAADDTADGFFTIQPLENPMVKILKIQSERFTGDAVSNSFLRSMIKLAHEKGIIVCAKEVENTYEYNTVRNFGVDLVQGSINGRPLHSKDFIKNLIPTTVMAQRAL